MFDLLPRVYLTWDESTEPLNSFLRYQIYRRIMGETVWSKRTRINDRSITFWTDTIVHSSVTYEYVVTVVADINGEELESDEPSPVSGMVVVQDVFIHDVLNSENYVQIFTPAQGVNIQQPINYVQPWSRKLPTAHVSHTKSKIYSLSMSGSWNDDSDQMNKEQWRALDSLVERQHEHGATLMIRQDHDIAIFGVIEGLSRAEAPILMSEQFSFRETFYREEVD